MNLDRILRNILIVGIFLVPFIPFIVSSSLFFPFITGKNFAFRILIEILLGSWIILALRDVTYRPTFSWIAVAVTAFVGIIAIADFTGVNPMKSIWSNFERMEGLVTLIHLLAYFFIASSVLKTQKLWTQFFNTTVIASAFMVLFAFVQLAGGAEINQGGVRVDGRLGNATYMAVYMLFHIFITALLLIKWRGGNMMRYVYGGLIFAQVVVLYFTATRGAILGLIGGVFLAALLILLFERNRPVVKKVGIGMILGMVLLVGGFFAIKNTEFAQNSPILSRFTSLSVESIQNQPRWTIWGMALEGAKERPLLGWGQENFNLVFNKYYQPELYGQEPWFDRVHNIFLDWLIAGGILGFLAYISMSLALLWYIWFKKSSEMESLEKILLTSLLAAYSFHNLFVFDNLISYIFFFTILAYVHTKVKEPQKDGSLLSKEVKTNVVYGMVTPIVIVLVVFSLYFFNAKGIQAGSTLIQAIIPHTEEAGGISRNLELFREALAYDSFANQEIREQLVQATTRIYGMNVSEEIKKEFFDLAFYEMNEQIKQAPNDARHELFMGSFLDSFGQKEAAGQHFARAVELSPNKQMGHFALSLNLIQLGRAAEAVTLLEDTLALDENFTDAHIMYANAAIYARDFTLADKILNDRFGTVLVNNNHILQAYMNTGQLSRVVDMWKERISQNPENHELHLALAGVYIQTGERYLAISEIEKAVELVPEFKAQGEYFIQEIRAGRNP